MADYSMKPLGCDPQGIKGMSEELSSQKSERPGRCPGH
jgi:hypothetical protein